MTETTVKVKPSTDVGAVDVSLDKIGSNYYPVYKISYGAFGEQTPVSHDNPMPVSEYWLDHAAHVIEGTYGDTVSVETKAKDLLKFGRNNQIGTSLATVMTLPAGVLHETYVTSNLITHFSSSDNADTGTMVVEGHTTADGGLTFTFVVQSVTLAGQTKTALTTPLARVTRAYNSNSVDWAGVIYIYQDDTVTAGVPATAAKVHLQSLTGENQSDKCSTTISNIDYWIVQSVYGDCLEKTAASVEFHLEMRLAGKVFRDIVDGSASAGHNWKHEFKPYLIVPKNSDIRLVAKADGANTQVSGGIQGALAAVI